MQRAEMTVPEGVPQGTVDNFTMRSPTARSVLASRETRHQTDRTVKLHTLPEALGWLWKDYRQR